MVCSACSRLIILRAVGLFSSIVGDPQMLRCHIYTLCINTHGFFPLTCLTVIKSLSGQQKGFTALILEEDCLCLKNGKVNFANIYKL